MTTDRPKASKHQTGSGGSYGNSRSAGWLVCVFLALATVAAYWPVRHFEFINYDDTDGIVRTPAIRGGLSWPSVRWAFANRHMGNWQPLTSLSHMLDCQLFRLRPGPPHVVNLGFHLANTVLLFLLLRALTGAHWRSAFVAGLFALHPLHVESVAWVSERKDVLSTFFFLLTLIAYTRYTQDHAPRTTHYGSRITHHASLFYALSLLFFTLGLLSKPMVVTLPFVLLLLDYWPLGRLSFPPARQPSDPPTSRLIFEKLPFLALALAMSGITLLTQYRSRAVAALSDWSIYDRLANAPFSCVRYLLKLLWPQGLIAYYPRVSEWPIGQIVGAVLLLIAVTVAVIRLGRLRRYLVVGWFWFLGTLVPVIGLVQVGNQAMADRYTYIPLIGLFVMSTWGIADLWAARRFPGFALALAASAALAACLLVTGTQVRYWRNSITLFEHVLAVRPDVALAHNNIASALYDQGRFEDAVPHLREALRLKPRYADAHNNLGLILWRSGQSAAALEHFAAVLQQGPEARAYYNKGVVLYSQGKLDQAKECFVAALRLLPTSAEAHNNLGNVLAAQGKLDAAGEQFAAAVEAAPDLVEAQCNLARYFVGKSAPEKAAACYTAALRARPSSADAHYGLATLLEQSGQLAEAAVHYAEAARLQPDLAEAHNNLSNIAAKQNNPQLALTHAQTAVRLKPDWAEAYYNLANAYFLEQRLDAAVAQYLAALRLKTNYFEAHQNLGYALEKLGRDEEAAEQYQQVVKARPDFAAAYNRLAVVLARQRRYPEAVKAAEEGIRLATFADQTRLLQELKTGLQSYRRGGRTN